MSEYRDLRDEMETNQEKASEPIAQDGMYGWQSEIIHEKAENEVKVQPQQENEYYTYIGAYAERTYKDLKRAAKKPERQSAHRKERNIVGKGRKTVLLAAWQQCCSVVCCSEVLRLVHLSVCFI